MSHDIGLFQFRHRSLEKSVFLYFALKQKQGAKPENRRQRGTAKQLSDRFNADWNSYSTQANAPVARLHVQPDEVHCATPHLARKINRS
jgi:hypothetical protein